MASVRHGDCPWLGLVGSCAGTVLDPNELHGTASKRSLAYHRGGAHTTVHSEPKQSSLPNEVALLGRARKACACLENAYLARRNLPLLRIDDKSSHWYQFALHLDTNITYHVQYSNSFVQVQRSEQWLISLSIGRSRYSIRQATGTVPAFACGCFGSPTPPTSRRNSPSQGIPCSSDTVLRDWNATGRRAAPTIARQSI